MSIGIYSIYWLNESLYYIGQSVNIEQRLNVHKSLLSRGEHYNYKISDAYLKYGVPEFSILELCTIDKLDDLEILYIKEFDSLNNGLNIVEGGSNTKYGYNSPKCKFTREQLIKAFLMWMIPENDYKIIAKETGVSEETVNSIRCQKRHTWLSEEFPEEYEIIKATYSARASIKQVKRFNKQIKTVLSPEGVEFEVLNGSKFAQENNLNKGHFLAVLRGAEYQHKGWKLKKEVSDE